MLSGMPLMVQAAVLYSLCLNPFSPFDDGSVSAEVDVGWRDVGEALVVAVVVIVIDEGADLPFEITGQVIVFEQNPVLERLMPALDFALGLGMVWRATNMIHALIFKPVGQVARYVG